MSEFQKSYYKISGVLKRFETNLDELLNKIVLEKIFLCSWYENEELGYQESRRVTSKMISQALKSFRQHVTFKYEIELSEDSEIYQTFTENVRLEDCLISSAKVRQLEKYFLQHNEDYTWVKLATCEFTLTEMQSKFIRLLHDGQRMGKPVVSKSFIKN